MPSRPIPQLHLPNFTKPRSLRPRALVIGAGISGLVAARDLAGAGYAVTVLEAAATAGGCVGSHTVAGLRLDSGAESFATRTTAVADLARELGLGDALVSPDPAGAWVQLPGGAVPLPRTGVLGIPADPWAPEVRRAVGLAGAVRAGLDRWLPSFVGTSQEETSVAELVRARMGRAVLDQLVAPVVGGVHSADPALLDVDMVSPGLRAAVRKHGSLAAAVAALRGASTGGATAGGGTAGGASAAAATAAAATAAAATAVAGGTAKAGSAVGGLDGGMHGLVDALLAALTAAGVVVTFGARAGSVARSADGTWTLTADKAPATGTLTYAAELLVVATDGPTAVALLSPELPAAAPFAPEKGPDVALVTLVVDRPELDVHPRGTGILVAPQTPGIRAKALTHATAKWAWLANAEGPGTHVLRLSYGRAVDGSRARGGSGTGGELPDQELPDQELPDRELLATALADASKLLDQPLAEEDLLGWDVVRWPGSLPFAAVGHRKKVQAFRALVAAQPNLLVVGGWLAGNGLAAVVGDTRDQVQRAPKPPAPLS